MSPGPSTRRSQAHPRRQLNEPHVLLPLPGQGLLSALPQRGRIRSSRRLTPNHAAPERQEPKPNSKLHSSCHCSNRRKFKIFPILEGASMCPLKEGWGLGTKLNPGSEARCGEVSVERLVVSCSLPSPPSPGPWAPGCPHPGDLICL